MNHNIKVIFLDIDGVCNSSNWYISEEYQKLTPQEELDLDPECIKRVNILCKETGAKIVISSDWRFDTNWKERLERAGLENIIGCTPLTLFGAYGGTYHFSRGEEIQMYLEWYPQIKNYIIVDDTTDMLRIQSSHFVQINPMYGFTEQDMINGIHLLNK